MTAPTLTRRQREIYDHLCERHAQGAPPPTLDELCEALDLASRGSMHAQVSSLVAAGLVEPMAGRQRGVRLAEPREQVPTQLPLLGIIAAGEPTEAVAEPQSVEVPFALRRARDCYALRVRGSSMIEEGILDGDVVIIERRDDADDGTIVVALVDGRDATLKRIHRGPGEVVLAPANCEMAPIVVAPERVRVQGVLVGQMRSYR